MNPAILKKIYRCLALANSSNSHEAAAAMRQAQALMAKYDISQQAILAVEVEKSTVVTDTRKAPPTWVQDLKTAVGKAFECHSFWTTWSKGNRKCEIVFIGVNPSSEIAAYAFSVLYRLLKKQRADYISTRLYRFKRTNKTAMADAFCTGWVKEVAQKCRVLNPNKTKSDKVAAYVAIHHPDIATIDQVLRFKASKSRVADAIRDGRLQAKNVSLHVPMGASLAKQIGHKDGAA